MNFNLPLMRYEIRQEENISNDKNKNLNVWK